eukprot:3444637-Alexandrium_andersonii.AAC.1
MSLPEDPQCLQYARGATPGDPSADVAFNLLAAILIQEISDGLRKAGIRGLQLGGQRPAPFSEFVLGSRAGAAASPSALRGSFEEVSYVDDMAFLALAPPGELLKVTGQLASVVFEVCS